MSNERSLSLLNSVNGDDEDPHSVEDQTTKKVRFKDIFDDVYTDMVVDSVMPSTPSWKDKLLGGVSTLLEMDRDVTAFGKDGESNGDFELLADDVQTSIVNGVPAISFSDRVKEILFKEMELTVVSKLLGRSIGYNTLHNCISSLWKLISQFHLMDIENGYYLVHFLNRTDYDRILSQGPWIIFGQYLTGQPWTKGFIPLQSYPDMVLAWIRLSGLLGFMICRLWCLKFWLTEQFSGWSTKPFLPFALVAGGRGATEETKSKFEPWLLVERQSRRGQRTGRSNTDRNNGVIDGAKCHKEDGNSRFTVAAAGAKVLAEVGHPSGWPTEEAVLFNQSGQATMEKGHSLVRPFEQNLREEIKSSNVFSISNPNFDVADSRKHSAITFKDSTHKKGKGSSAKSSQGNFGEGVSISRERLGVFISFVYESPNKQKCKDLWDILKSSILKGNFPWAVIGDFNVILSPSKKSDGMTKVVSSDDFGHSLEDQVHGFTIVFNTNGAVHLDTGNTFAERIHYSK
ncbi:hypothetical protein J1N35_008460 [Gossypium stocksii]|uniref:DUF4283 domain-containing protein n=1 Tax=Gossypium stocksii TaxID=47602 RepID=A0A9D3W9G0_9ROSI|nr:hypothetical protein J1N35_008460 [Gossypium stocksii]